MNLEIWGGIECSVIRIGNATRNQLARTGHTGRESDLEAIAALGLKTLRYPVLWELIEENPGQFDWTFADGAMEKLRQLGVKPIAGLLHHGSGPRWADITDHAFPTQFGHFAGRVAERYPWIDLYTPVNEPFTTARLSGLYGLWHPHGSDEATCFRLTVTQCLATIIAIQKIRRVNPNARLVQTEDFGRVFSTPPLAYQADHENERRWLSIDLLTGRVDRHHPLFQHLLDAGVPERSLALLAEAPCPPDIIGIDYYLTSDRCLDERTHLYPCEPVGGNGRDTYVDVAAVRADLPDGAIGLLPRLGEVWARYGIPIAVTELHNGSTREEQVRWLMDGWRAAEAARAEGIDVRAATSWALLGSLDWNSMMVGTEGYYENGAFDIRSDPPRPTLIADVVRSLVTQGGFDHPVLDRAGWWRPETGEGTPARPILLAGIGRAVSGLMACCDSRKLRALPVESGDPLDQMTQQSGWALVHVDCTGPGRGFGARSFQASFRAGGQLRLDARPSFDFHACAHAFLDLVVDGQEGWFGLTRAGQCNQYDYTDLQNAQPSLRRVAN
ncbi:MAG: family 1 glycosylhydrolase [Mesorhizobium sp.]|nr:family 1 glycosylhydrolase [Mesorhizobium sp.]